MLMLRARATSLAVFTLASKAGLADEWRQEPTDGKLMTKEKAEEWRDTDGSLEALVSSLCLKFPWSEDEARAFVLNGTKPFIDGFLIYQSVTERTRIMLEVSPGCWPSRC